MTSRLPWTEAIKLACLAATLPLVVGIEHVPLAATLWLSLAHLGWLAASGYCLLRITRSPVPASPADALVVCYLLGWSTLGVFGLAARLHGQVGLEVIGVLAVGLGWVLVRRPRGLAAGEASVAIPWGVYALALSYVALSVALPFSFFAETSIAREFYGDGVQRFATIYALADRVPPPNPFMSGLPLRYYWLGMLPYAAEYRWVWPDLFAVWKCGQTWTAMLFLPALWFVVRGLGGCRAVAWWALLLGLVFASWEALAHPALRGAVGSLREDPDMILGIVQPWSDQLLLEDFLYIPHNAWALMMALGSLWLLARGKLWGALPGLTVVAAVNTFFAIPVGIGYAAVAVSRWGRREALGAIGAYVGLVAGWLALVGIAPGWGYWGIAVALPLGMVTRAHCLSPARAAWALPGAALAMLIALTGLLLLDVRYHPWAYVLNYGPAVIAGVYLLIRLTRRRERAPASLVTGLVFLLSASAAVLLVTAALLLADAAWAPPGVRELAARVGDTINPFNFYHKTAKLVRLTWALLGALGLVEALGAVNLPARRWLLAAGGACLLLSAETTIWRPLTYAVGHPVAEVAAARFLRAQGVGLETTVLAQDYRGTAINMLAPVSSYCYSQWGEGNLGLSTRRGTWLDQYLPAAARPQSRARELAVERFFSPTTTGDQRAALPRAAGVDYVLTREPWAAGALAREVVAQPGGYLYQIITDQGRRSAP